MSNEKNQKLAIKVFGSKRGYKTYDYEDEKKVINLVRDEVVEKPEAYHSVRVKIKRKVDGSPDSLVVYMLGNKTYTAEVVKVNIEGDYKLKDIEKGYDDSLDIDEDEDDNHYGPSKEDYGGYDFIASTPVPEISSAKQAAEYIHQLANKVGLRSKLLLGPQASVSNYKNYLKSGLSGFVNIGHGYTGGIVLADGTLTSSWFQGLTNKQLGPAVIYFNSCQVFNNPLQPAVMSGGARTFIGGIVNLLIGPSEKVCKCFWKSSLSKGEEMGVALKTCEANNYPQKGAHGISGDTGIFHAGHLIIYQHANFRGHHRHIFGWERNLNHPEDNSLNDKISSFVVISGTWNFYRHWNYVGQQGGDFNTGAYRWVEAIGIDNDQVSSMKCIRS